MTMARSTPRSPRAHCPASKTSGKGSTRAVAGRTCLQPQPQGVRANPTPRPMQKLLRTGSELGMGKGLGVFPGQVTTAGWGL